MRLGLSLLFIFLSSKTLAYGGLFKTKGKLTYYDINEDKKIDFYDEKVQNGFNLFVDNKRVEIRKRDKTFSKKVFERYKKDWRLLESTDITKKVSGNTVTKTYRNNSGTLIQKSFKTGSVVFEETKEGILEFIIGESYEFFGKESPQRRLKRIRTEYNKESLEDADWGLCLRDEIMSLSSVDDLLDNIDDIVVDLTEDVSRLFDVKDCGKSFKFNHLPNALIQGLDCLEAMGGDGRRHAAEMVAILRHSEQLTGKKFKVDCSEDSVKEQLLTTVKDPSSGKDMEVVSAHGVAYTQCEEHWPGVVLHPGTEGEQSGGSKQEREQKQQATFFHELFHNLGYFHTPGEVDLTYMCTFACFAVDSFPNASQIMVDEATSYCRGDKGPESHRTASYLETMNNILNEGEHATGITFSKALYSPSKAATKRLLQSRKNHGDTNFDGDTFLYFLVAGDLDKIGISNEKAREKVEAIFGHGSFHKFRKTNYMNYTGDVNHLNADLLARQFKEYYYKAYEVSQSETPSIAGEIWSGLQTIWKGFCTKHKDSIKDMSHCKEDN